MSACALYAGCADEDSGAASDSESGGDPDDDEASEEGGSKDAPGLDAGSGSSARDAGLPAEQEETLSFDIPRAGLTSVFIPNPVTNRVAVVNATTFAIEDLAVGSQPTFAATVPEQDVALVLNVGTRDAALLRTEQGRTSVLALPVGHDANAIAIAPGGMHGVIYLDANAAKANAQSFQDLTVVDLVKGSERSRRISVGFRPRGVQFSADGRQAFVITEDGISVVDLTTLEHRLVQLGDALGDPQSVDVQVTPNGAFALARREGESVLRLIHLADQRVETLSLASLPLPNAPVPPPPDPDAGPSDAGPNDAGVPAIGPELTDLDLAPDGSFAIAVVRDRGALVRIPLPQGFSDPSTIRVRAIEDQLIGSITLAKAGKTAIAYTTVAAIEGVVVIPDIDGDAPVRGIRLRKAVRAVALSDDGKRALILHTAVNVGQNPANEDARIDGSEGYSVLDTESGFSKLQLTSARIREQNLLLTPDGTRVFALLRDDAKSVRGLDMVDLASFQVTNLTLTKPPTSIGLLPLAPGQARVFIGHAAEGGMITFLDAQAGTPIREVSGFEIASRIRQ